jgi:hypothetical protein
MTIINQFQIGDVVSFDNNQGETIKGTFICYATIITFAKILGSDMVEYERKVTQIKFISRKEQIIHTRTNIPKLFDTSKPQPKELKKETNHLAKQVENVQKYDINQRFSFLESLVRMVGKGFRNALVITGKGGLGKSHTIEQEFELLGLQHWNPETKTGDYKVIKGTSTAKGYFNTLKKYNDIILIFDDCKKVLLDSTIIEISKGALDTKKHRSVCWVTADGEHEFEYTGRSIYLANLQHSQLDEAFKTRASVVDVSMTPDEMIQRIRFIASKEGYRTDIDEDLKQEAIKIIEENKHCEKLSIRTFLEAMDYIAAGEENWRDLLIYSMQ